VRLLRIVPDDTKFDFMRFRRVSFPMSAVLSIFAIFLYFHPGLNLGIDFRGGTLIEVQSKTGPADLAKMRATLSALNLGDVQLQQFGAPSDVLIRIGEQPGGDEAQRAAFEASRISVTVVKRNEKQIKGFIVLPKRWVVERTFGWINRARRLAKDFEATIESSLA